jgi:nucleoid DNA-binding protein
MDKQDLINFVAAQTGSTKFDGIIAGLKANKDVLFVKFGSFAVQVSAARKGRNPRTGLKFDIKG